MKFLFFSILVFLINFSSQAEIDNMVFIEGTIGTAFTKTEVLVTDEFNQKYYLPKKSFPKDYKFVAHEKFNLEIDKSEFDDIKLIKE